jgi:hypothetical protein
MAGGGSGAETFQRLGQFINLLRGRALEPGYPQCFAVREVMSRPQHQQLFTCEPLAKLQSRAELSGSEWEFSRRPRASSVGCFS